MNTRAIGARARHRGFSAHAVPRNTSAARATATQAWVSVRRPVGSSRALVRGLRASSSRSAIRLKPSATNRALVNARMTSPSVRHVIACSRDATSSPSRANGSANTVWGSLTKFAYRTSRLSPLTVCPSRGAPPPSSTALHRPPPPSQFNPQLLPHRVDLPLRLRVHDDPVRPFPREPFFLPLARRIDPHFGAEREAAARVIEDVDRPHREPHVALGVDVIQRHPPRLLGIAHVHVLVQHDDHLGERHQPLPPQPVHDLLGLPGLLLVDANEHEVV